MRYTQKAENTLLELKRDLSKKRILKDVVKALRYMEIDLRHPSLNTHQYHNLNGKRGDGENFCWAQIWIVQAFLPLLRKS